MNDHNEIRDIQEKMQECIRNINRLAPLVGAARQVKEFSNDQRKNALAAQQVIYIQRGESVAAAENLARANPVYVEKFRDLEKSYAEACATIAEWEAAFARLEAARSIHAMMKETLKTLEG
jgi:hypothetical protein